MITVPERGRRRKSIPQGLNRLGKNTIDEGYGLQPVRKPNRIIGPLGPEGMLFTTSRPKSCPQGLKPIYISTTYVRAEARTLQKTRVFPQPVKPVPFEGRVNIESEWAAKKRERAAEQPHLSQKKA
jgi:hypothetical protein